VGAAADGQEAIAAIEELRPDLVLLDVMMPNVDGVRVLEEMRERRELANVPIMIVTGRADAHAVFDPVVGHDNVITKPFDAAQLVGRVHQVLSESGGA
jgi:DNA-binding response OmpR family regulator